MTSAVLDDRRLDPQAEFDRQVDRLVRLKWPRLMGESPAVFVRRVAPLRDALAGLPEPVGARIPFVLVPGEGLVSRVDAVGLTQMDGHAGFTSMPEDDLKRFVPTSAVEIPDRPYLLVDVDTGPDTIDVVPDEALPMITGAGRSPLTIDEGLALVIHVPDILRTRNSFSMLASRCGDRRVPAIWVSDRRPRLGWCWAGAPHSWLGSASAGDRLS